MNINTAIACTDTYFWEKYVYVHEHYRRLRNGKLVFVHAHYRRKWGTRC